MKRRFSLPLRQFLLIILIGFPTIWKMQQENKTQALTAEARQNQQHSQEKLWEAQYQQHQLQQYLDQELIKAIKTHNNQRALTLLAIGANGEAQDAGADDYGKQLHALPLLYQIALDDKRVRDIPNPKPNPAVIRALLDHGAQLDDGNSYGYAPLSCAVQFHDADTVKLLLERGANIEEKDGVEETPLMKAADAAITKVLLDHGANMEARDFQHLTPLMWATLNTNPDVVRVLLEHGAKVSSKTAEGYTALYFASGEELERYAWRIPGDRKIATLLRKHGAK